MSTYEAVLPETQHGVRVDLRQLVPDDADALQQLLTHPEVQRHILIRSGAGSVHAQIEKLVNRMLYAFDPCALHAGIYLKELQILIGIVALQNWNRREGTATLGYMLSPVWWGYGHATEAVGLLLNYSVHTLGIRRIEGRCTGNNIRSERVMIKNGMKLERVLPRAGASDDVMKVFTLLHK